METGNDVYNVAALSVSFIYPLPFSLVLQWLAYALVEFIIAGIAAAAIYRPMPEFDGE